VDRRVFLSLIGQATLAAAPSSVAGLMLTAEARAQQRGGTMVIAISGEPTAIIGFNHTDTGGHAVAANIFSGLIGFDADFRPTPELAESWQISEDGKTYTFRLNKAAKFHDGKPVTAEDVAFTFNDVVSKHHPSAASWWPNVAAAKAVDSHTFVLELKEPYPALMSLLAYELRSGTQILPKHLYAGKNPMTNPVNDRPVGSGAFKFKEWVKGSHVTLVRNDDYFMPGRPYLDQVIIQFIPDASTRILAFERGEVDFIDFTAVPHNEVKRLTADKRFKLVSSGDAIGSVGMWLMNLRHEILGKPQVRKALFHALDLKDIADKSFFGAGRPASSFLNSSLKWAFDPSFNVYGRDLQKANVLLDEAGYKRDASGNRFKLRIFWAAGRTYDGKSAEIIRDQLRDVGVVAEVQTFDRSTFVERVFAQWTFDTAIQGFSTGPDPSISVVTRYHTKAINRAPFTNAMGYSNPRLDAIFDADASERDEKKRAEYWKQAQQILMEDLPAVPVFELPDGHLSNAKLVDAVTGPFGYFQSRHQAYFKS